MASQELVQELEERLGRLDAGPRDALERIDVLNDLAWELGLVDGERSLQLLREARELAETAGYEMGMGRALRTAGYHTMLRSELKEALEQITRALEHLDHCGDALGKATAQFVLTNIHLRLGNYDRALENGQATQALYEAIEDWRGLAWAYADLGTISKETGDLEAADEAYANAMAVFQRNGYKVGIARVQGLRGELNLLRGRHETSLEQLTEAMEIATSMNFEVGRAFGHLNMGRVLHELGRYDEAVIYR